MNFHPEFHLVCVSEQAYDLIADLEAAWYTFAHSDVDDLHAVGDAYAAWCQRRKELHEYIEKLEFNARIPRPVKIRFD